MAEITKTKEWLALKNHYKELKASHMRDLFKQDSQRFEKNHIQLEDFLFDFSKNRITEDTKKLLLWENTSTYDKHHNKNQDLTFLYLTLYEQVHEHHQLLLIRCFF